jgi:phosphoserine aminotransferase
MKKHNFSAGPCILPPTVLKEASEAVLNWNNSGLSLIEVSHRGKEFVAVMDEARQLVKDLLDVPANYEVRLLHHSNELHESEWQSCIL